MMEILGLLSSIWLKILLALLIIWLGIPLVLLFVGFVIYPLCRRIRRWIIERRHGADISEWEDKWFRGLR